jgi:diguanylate cyclase (GGDEF)-like protein
MAGRDLEGELRELQAHVATLLEQAATNERLYKKSQEREIELLRAATLEELFNAICVGLVKSYGVDQITLALCDPRHEIRHLLAADHIEPAQHPNVIFTDDVAKHAPVCAALERPWLGTYEAEAHRALFPGEHALRSVALIPLSRGGQLQGSLNFGSTDATRFARHLATDFLGHMGVIAGFALETAINRARLVRSGVTDFLTGWHNRRYLHARLREELLRAQRCGSCLVCLVIDVDRFKQINDQYGHLAGDMVLREASQRVAAHIRGSDAAARFGGDEFVVLAPDLTMARAAVLAERIRAAVNASPVTVAPGVTCQLTVSIGVAGVIPFEQTSDLQRLAEQLLADADAALYRAKKNGRNCVAITGLAEPALEVST